VGDIHHFLEIAEWKVGQPGDLKESALMQFLALSLQSQLIQTRLWADRCENWRYQAASNPTKEMRMAPPQSIGEEWIG
jgi:hypothetical protein